MFRLPKAVNIRPHISEIHPGSYRYSCSYTAIYFPFVDSRNIRPDNDCLSTAEPCRYVDLLQ